MADFIAEFAGSAGAESNNHLSSPNWGQDMEIVAAKQTNPVQAPLLPEHHMDVDPNAWFLFIDGSSVINGSRVGIVFRTLE